MTYLFVYGSLKRKFDLPYAQLLRANAGFVSEGAMHAIMYKIDNYPGAVESAEVNAWVQGEIYLLKPDSDTLTVLDVYEGFLPMFPSQSEFVRKRVPARLCDGNWLTCWVYLYNLDVSNLARIHDF
ncbi:MAG: gamma-glutamylcyclotransferase family protein [Bacteroidota bacterium]